MEKDRNLRYQHAAEMRTDLQRLKRDTRSHGSGGAGVSARYRNGGHGGPPHKKKWSRIGAGLVAIVVAVLVGYLIRRPVATTLSQGGEKSIAVLPFVNMSSDKEQEYFSDGISEELLNLLAKIPELKVAARTSSFSFKGKEVEIREIARQLQVAHVLEGSVRKSGDSGADHGPAHSCRRRLSHLVADL